MAFPRYDIFDPQTIRKEIILTLNSAGRAIPIITGIATIGITIPEIAKPIPLSRPLLLAIIITDIIPKINATGAVKKKKCTETKDA